MNFRIFILTLFLLSICCGCQFESSDSGRDLKENAVAGIDDLPILFGKAFQDARTKVDSEIEAGIDVPIPKDMAGGYTHERHKANYTYMQLAGNLFRITEDKKYAKYIKDILIQYAAIYNSLPIHPTMKSYATGKIFWQCLNDANFLVFASQAYESIYEFLTKEERKDIENNFFKPYADFISVDNPQFFNRIHNHSTWGNAAVGMIGLAIKDEVLLERALYGLKLDETDFDAKDNDGGFIYNEGKPEAGFFAQIDNAFSPDGYYNEGPYYQRYAMLPFLVFANALHEKKPDLKIFEYRDSILLKGVKALANQTDGHGHFFPINDAQKGMSIHASSVVTAVDIAYAASRDKEFLDIAKLQNEVVIDPYGLEVAKSLMSYGDEVVNKKSLLLRDGKNGDEGGFAILRSGNGNNEINVAFKFTSQGLGHGHYDKLSYSLYDGSTELLQDYGAARWVNIDQKAGGRYLPENNSWAKQSIAHNTLVVDQTSHFGGIYDLANLHHSELEVFEVSNPNFQIVSAKEVNAYSGIEMFRTLILLTEEHFEKPLVIDVFSVFSNSSHTYDMPYQHAAQLMNQNFTYTTQEPKILGKSNGYQHLYVEAKGKITGNQLQMNLMKDDKFYTITASANLEDEIIFARVGANDVEFNLRRDPLLIHRKTNENNATFVTLIESHGHYSRDTEVPIQPYSKVKNIKIIEQSNEVLVFVIESKDNSCWKVQMKKRSGKGATINSVTCLS